MFMSHPSTAFSVALSVPSLQQTPNMAMSNFKIRYFTIMMMMIIIIHNNTNVQRRLKYNINKNNCYNKIHKSI